MPITQGFRTSLPAILLASAATATAQGSPPPARAVEAAEIAPTWGNIGAFGGSANPLWGNIGAFWGDANPYWGNIGAFWGNIGAFNGEVRPNWGNIGAFEGQALPTWGNIGAFWGNIGAFWGNIGAFWGNIGAFAGNEARYGQLAGQIEQMVAQSETFWGAAVAAQSGQPFRTGFAATMLARHGIDLDDPASLAALTADQRAHFFQDWYDGLMSYTGADHADHWMRTVKWRPSITQQQGAGSDTKIGLLDFVVAEGADASGNIVAFNGYEDVTNGHGTGVASLMVSAHDGRGVMGIAPRASVVAYNPFDDTETASWADITSGVKALTGAGASIVNMSLGVPGWALHGDWKGVFSDPAVAATRGKTAYVVAAGNDGIAQTQNIAWNWATDPALLVVGSVDPYGRISDFSNRPGEACLLNNGVCTAAGMLKSRFVVAPGELILVDDGDGGVIRRSGTSFAAPLVSGAIALLHDRWPWLANHPKASVDIILKSAKDLGAPGVDPVYGAGLLDVEASQSPLNFNTVQWKLFDGTRLSTQKLSAVLGTSDAKMRDWETKGMYFYVFEQIGSTHRDFAIPLSSKLVDSTYAGYGSNERFQGYMYDRLVDWIKASRSTGFAPDANTMSFGGAGWGLSVSMASRPTTANAEAGRTPFQSSVQVTSPSRDVAFRFGHGEGARAMGVDGVGFASSYDAKGGINPILGLASGGAYAGVNVAVAPGLRIAGGVTEQRVELLSPDSRRGDERQLYEGLEAYKSAATNLSVAYDLTRRLTLTAAYTQLGERTGLLGLQSLDPTDFADGSTTDAGTLGARFAVTDSLTLAGAATMGRTRSGDGGQNIAVGDRGLATSAFELSVAKDRLLGRTDRLQVSLSQPMHLEDGTVDYTTLMVVDRQTGAVGPVTQSFEIGGGARQYIAEARYGLGFWGDAGEVSLFGRAKLRPDGDAEGEADLLVGGRVAFGF